MESDNKEKSFPNCEKSLITVKELMSEESALLWDVWLNRNPSASIYDKTVMSEILIGDFLDHPIYSRHAVDSINSLSSIKSLSDLKDC